VAEVVEGSLMLATQTMLLLGIPLNKVLTRLRTVRGERYQLMRGFFPGATDADDTALDAQQPRLQSIIVEAGAAAVGSTIEALNLSEIDITLTALRRHGVRDMSPAEDTRLVASDVLILTGTPQALARAEMRIMQG